MCQAERSTQLAHSLTQRENQIQTTVKHNTTVAVNIFGCESQQDSAEHN